MIPFHNYIFEKLHLNKDIDFKRPFIETLENVVIATFVQCARDKNYKENSEYQKTIYRGQIDYEYIVGFLNEHFNFGLDEEKAKKGNPTFDALVTLIKTNLNYVESLLNYKPVRLKIDKESAYLDGKELYKKYFNVISKKTKY